MQQDDRRAGAFVADSQATTGDLDVAAGHGATIAGRGGGSDAAAGDAGSRATLCGRLLPTWLGGAA